MIKTNQMNRTILKRIFFVVILAVVTLGAHAQRFTDKLDHGIVAVNLGSNTFVSWRRNADEYYGTTYNLYCDGSKVAENLSVTNWTGSARGTFTVRPVVDGVEQAADDASAFSVAQGYTPLGQYSATVWGPYGSAGLLNLTLASVMSRDNRDVTHHYWPNDMIFADLDGDGQLEFILKRINIWDANNTYPIDNTTEYVVWEAYDVNWATGATQRMWWIDCGPNMVSLNSTENNLLAFDWDMDGCAEVVMRGADNMVFHHNDGTSEVIGDGNVNTRGDFNHTAGGQYAWTMSGNEYLIYFNGQTGATYQVMDYPLKRFESNENPNDIDAAWHGRGQYGHVSSKYFFGAPYLDGQKPSLFIGRGIYTRHKMMALDLNPGTHQFAQRWEWHSTPNGNTPGSYWYGNGNHNFVIADVDEDGRDEIIYGSMVIDDNGQGLHSTGYGHGDAMHVNDFDPYRKGLEIFTCIEDEPTWGMAYRSGLTGKVYKKFNATGDDGRCIAGNFTNTLPGSVGKSWHSDALALTSDKYISDHNLMFSFKVGGVESQKENYRIYWDGDLLSEQFDGVGAHDDGRSPTVFKWNPTNMNSDRIFNPSGLTINGTKNNPNFLGDILGDWREEFVLRESSGQTVTEDGVDYSVFDRLKVYTTTTPTDYSIYTLWADHQYRQAMGTQMQVYNLPPNASFFLGEMEGITQAPPPLTKTGRVEVRKNGTIASTAHGQHVMLAETGNATVTVENGAAPAIFTDNAPSWVQGHNASEATAQSAPTTTVYTHTLTGAAFSGSTRVVKQGGGVLVLPKTEQTYSGSTDVWAGTLQFDGKMTSSPVWLNRFATLSSTGGEFNSVDAEYGSRILPGGEEENISSVTIHTLNLGFGSRVVFDLGVNEDDEHDQLNVTELSIEKKTDNAWTEYGPETLAPVFDFRVSGTLTGERFPIGSVTNLTAGDLSDIIIEGVDKSLNPLLEMEDGILYLVIDTSTPSPEPVIEIIDMVNVDLTTTFPSSSATTYYLPKVGIVGDEAATLSGTFTNLAGQVTDLGSSKQETILAEDYESANSVEPWQSRNASEKLSLVTGDAIYGNYVCYDFTDNGGHNSRGASWWFGELGELGNNYVVEFDASLKPGDNQQTELTVMAGLTDPINDNYASDTNHSYLFDITNQGGNSTSYTVNQSDTKVTIPSDTWCHYRIEVDVTNRSTKWTIINNSTQSVIATGLYTLADDALDVPKGIFVRAGKYRAVIKFDNLNIVSYGSNLREYVFKEPGTLRVTATLPGRPGGTAVFTADHPYVKANLDDYLAEDFEGSTDVPQGWTSPSAGNQLSVATGGPDGNYLNFNIAGASYNGSRSAYRSLAGLNYDSQVYTVSFDAAVTPGNNQQTQVALLGGNLPTQNWTADAGYLFSAKNTGANSTTFVINGKVDNTVNLASGTWYHFTVTVDKEAKTASWTIINNATNAVVGTGSYDLPEGVQPTATYLYLLAGRYTGALKVDNIVISPLSFLPVSIGDELAVVIPETFEGGNAHIWRNGLTTATSWSSLVLPFNLDQDQVKALFGENTVVANLVQTAGTEKIMYFDTQAGTITANQPVLIKGVEKPSPYLIQGVDVLPVASPIVENPYYQFIGNYDNLGRVPFYNGDYFFSNNKLSKVAYDGVLMTLKGFRAYFHAINSDAASVSVFFDSPDGITDLSGTMPATYTVYTLSGVLVRRDATSLHGLQPGLYIVNGKKLIVK